ncbi:MAG: PAS domain-containing sensor histidine kinase [Epsilonproteobacteria bacterium]|nr:PAS domain-containing sensor histidine kinase [Campylobacterota bacterium]
MSTKYNHEFVNNLNFENVLLDTLPNPVYYKDKKGRIIRANTAFAELMNTSKEKIIGQLAYNFFQKSSTDRHKKIDKEIMKTLQTNVDELILYMPQGDVKYFILNKAVYLNEDRSIGGIVCVMNDITQNIKQKEFLIQQSKLAEMGEMIASIAHQWNEPLVELSALIQRMELHYSINRIDKNKMADFVNDAMTQIKYMSETQTNFRNFLKPSTVKKSFGAKKVIKEIFEIIGKQLFYLNIEVDFRYRLDDEEIFIYGYENELKQVLLNIINNAKNKIIKVRNEQKIKGKISIEIYADNNYNTINIIDNAGAIQSDVIGQLFEPFFTTKSDGTGLGLYLAKVIVEDKMSGKIGVKNHLNSVIFSIEIPIKKA